MATLSAILGNLATEIEGRIVGLTPTNFATHTFRVRSAAEQYASELASVSAAPRAVDVGGGGGVRWVRNLTCGSANRAQEIFIPVSIRYPARRDWQFAAFDDFDRISEDMRDNATSVTGCSLREVDAFTQPVWAVDTEDPQFAVMEFEVYAIVVANP